MPDASRGASLVRGVPENPNQPEPGTALCLSGGGFRAMRFHVGALWRLKELGSIRKLDRISSVSGGSITAGMLGPKWPRLGFGANGVSAQFQPEIVAPLRAFARRTDDVRAVVIGLLSFTSADASRAV